MTHNVVTKRMRCLDVIQPAVHTNYLYVLVGFRLALIFAFAVTVYVGQCLF